MRVLIPKSCSESKNAMLSIEAPPSILRPRTLSCTDIVENARALFQGSVPAVIESPVMGLCAWDH